MPSTVADSCKGAEFLGLSDFQVCPKKGGGVGDYFRPESVNPLAIKNIYQSQQFPRLSNPIICQINQE